MVPYVALFAWPLVSLVFFRRFGAPIAVLVTILAGYLVLPEKAYVDLPIIPTLNKNTIPALAALGLAAALAIKLPRLFPSLSGWVPRSWWLRLLIFLAILGVVMSTLTNQDPLIYGEKVLPGMRLYDAFSGILTVLMSILPVLLARKFLCSGQAHRSILMAFCIAGLAYSLLILIELRMSPQLHYWIYGYFPHVWLQHVRSGGWRPVVFLSHGLLVGMFLCFAVLSAVALFKSEKTRKGLYIMGVFWLLLVLLLSKNLGALLIAFVLIPTILLLGKRLQLWAAMAIAVIFISYPAVRNSDYFPLQPLLSFANDISPERAASLEYRFFHENNLLAKFQERPVFGWGGWGRNRVYDNKGNDITVTDGAWIILVSTSGWVGYVAQFGIITLPLLLMPFYRRRYDYGPETAALAILLAANLVDLMPNASLTPLTFLLAGALWGRLELGRAQGGTDDAAVLASTEEKGRPTRARERLVEDGPDIVPELKDRPSYTRQDGRIEHRRRIRERPNRR
jgi:hypothetical protein